MAVVSVKTNSLEGYAGAKTTDDQAEDANEQSKSQREGLQQKQHRNSPLNIQKRRGDGRACSPTE
jgi:hypothetical protein